MSPEAAAQLPLGIEQNGSVPRRPPSGQLLKWIGNKQRSAAAIAAYLPSSYRHYFEPFVGAGAVLATVAPQSGFAGDVLGPLVELWQLVQRDPDRLIEHYRLFRHRFDEDRRTTYAAALASYNSAPNALDLLCLCRSCYGGVVRFTKLGTMSTPIGVHRPIPPEAFESRLVAWAERVRGTTFAHASFAETMAEADAGDVVYCDPPYSYAQEILYGAQSFDLEMLWTSIADAARRGAKVALSIDGRKRSGTVSLHIAIPDGLFAREIFLEKGGSMLKRFQRRDRDVQDEHVSDRLLLTW